MGESLFRKSYVKLLVLQKPLTGNTFKSNSIFKWLIVGNILIFLVIGISIANFLKSSNTDKEIKILCWISWNSYDCRHNSLFSPVLGSSSYSCLALWSSLCYVVIWQCYFWHPFMCFFEFKIEARFTRCYSWNSPNLNSWTLTQKEIRPISYGIWKRWNN